MAASMLKTQCFIFYLTIITLFSTLAVSDHRSNSDVFGKDISPSSLGLKREKLSHLHFYFHDIVSGKNATAIHVAGTSSNNSSLPLFGDIYMIDDPLTINPDINSKTVGKAQGMYAYSSQTEMSLLMVLNFAFTEGKYNGSTLSVLARNEVLNTLREMPIVGGTGSFRFARGYAQARTHSITLVHAIVEYNVFVFHY
ncbi:Dirigent protein 2 [Hibiscus syriacus]|uniref:Dirigent protein n=1 Tax=Hibiscus syriacus TaxID=106335 RepID=A0A6A2XFW9_HIBSY|nr:dirigent protein 2-like [Hibiscus syriacus]KAE8674288.1 Dirigent protein 2 [Hibiscus syriacus]